MKMLNVYSILKLVVDPIHTSNLTSIQNSTLDTVGDLVYNSVWDIVEDSVRNLIWNIVEDSVEESIKEEIYENA